MTESPDRANTGFALALIAAPVLWLAAEAVSPQLKAKPADQLAVIGQNPDRWYGYTALLIVGTMLLLPAVLGITRLTRAGAPRLTAVGGILLGFGTLVAVGDAMSQLVTWQMVAAGADRAQMAALLDRSDNAGGVVVFFSIGGLSFFLGSILLAIALFRTSAVAKWAAVGFAAGMILQIVGFTANSVVIIAASSIVLIAAMGQIARVLVTRPTFARTLSKTAPTPSGMRA